MKLARPWARDRLGSVSLATDDQGYLLSQARYTPYGQVGWNGGTVMPTKFAFTSETTVKS
jgi:hypothetical protein